jgi:hypothetical protein
MVGTLVGFLEITLDMVDVFYEVLFDAAERRSGREMDDAISVHEVMMREDSANNVGTVPRSRVSSGFLDMISLITTLGKSFGVGDKSHYICQPYRSYARLQPGQKMR